MTDKNRVHHLLDLAAKEVPDTVNLWPRIRDKAAQKAIFDEKAGEGILLTTQSVQRKTPQKVHGRALSFSFAMTCAVLILGGILLLNARVPAEEPEPLYAGFPLTSEVLTTPVTSRTGRGKAVEAVWSPDGTRMLVVTTQGIWIYDAADLTQPIENIYSEMSFSQAPIFSHDSAHLAFLDGGEAHIWPLTERRDITIDVSHETTQAYSIALTADASTIAVGDQNGTVHFYDVQTQTLLSSAHIIESATPIIDVEFNASGTSLALIGQDVSPSFFFLEDLTGQWKGALQAIALPADPAHKSPLGAVAYSEDRSHIVGRFGDSLVVWAWDGQILRRTNWMDSVHGEGRLVMNQKNSQVALLSQDMWVWHLTSDSISLTQRIPGTDLPWTGVMNLNTDWSQISMVDSLGHLSVRDWHTGEELMSSDAYTKGF